MRSIMNNTTWKASASKAKTFAVAQRERERERARAEQAHSKNTVMKGYLVDPAENVDTNEQSLPKERAD